MDPNDFALEELLERASASVLKSVDDVVDVHQRLRDLLHDAGLDPALAEDNSRRTL